MIMIGSGRQGLIGRQSVKSGVFGEHGPQVRVATASSNFMLQATEAQLTMVDFPARALAELHDRATSWWVAQSRPQYEERLARDIRLYGGIAFVPREIVVKTYEDKHEHRHTVRSTRPVFAGYTFYAGDRDIAFESDVLLKVLKTTPQDCRDIENLYLACQAGQVQRATVKGLNVGILVKVVAGPFIGREGYVERFGDTRVVLRVGTLGGAEFTTHLSYIEPILGD